jgi:transposase
MIPVSSLPALSHNFSNLEENFKFNDMDRNRTVASLDVHKDSIYLCIMGHDGAIIFEKSYRVLTPELRQMCNDMVNRGVTEAAMESTAVYWM